MPNWDPKFAVPLLYGYCRCPEAGLPASRGAVSKFEVRTPGSRTHVGIAEPGINDSRSPHSYVRIPHSGHSIHLTSSMPVGPVAVVKHLVDLDASLTEPSVPEMDRSRGFHVPKTKTPTGMGWRSVRDVLGGPGRNRTTDTRIFKTRVRQSRQDVSCCVGFLPRRTVFTSVHPSQSLIRTREPLQQ